MIDLSLLPPPDVVEMLDFEALLVTRKAQYLSSYPLAEQPAIAARLALKSDPVTKLLEESTYRELVLRQRVNDAAKASLLAYATGGDLENRAADYGVQKLILRPADPDAVPPLPAVMENDEALRYRTRLSLEALSSAGSRGAYEYHALSASASVASVSVDSPRFIGVAVPDAIKAQLPAGAIVLVCEYDAGLTDPLPGDVSLAILPRVDSQEAPGHLVDLVQEALSAESVRPITDRPRAQLGQPVDFTVVATLELEAGPEPAVVKKAAQANLDAAIAKARDLEGELSRSAIYAALHVSGVRRVDLAQPATELECDKRHYPNCTAIDLRTKVVA
ncbi:baseplate assembly protein [Pseudomonas fortuita]|uniref:baseplate assembly protein n=1 Tax=Pseudomonas fortuita TaxID=3233375 RepID=UPI003C2C7EF5